MSTSDPRRVSFFVRFMVDRLTKKTRDSLGARLDEISAKNRQFVTTPYDAYSYGGSYFSTSWVGFVSLHPWGTQLQELDKSLVQFHLDWRADLKAHEEEVDKIRQTISALTIKHKEHQDWKDMFPDVITDGLFSEPIPRTRVTLCLVSNPEAEVRAAWPEKSIRLYNKIAPTIAYYAGQQLL